jgi:hypothetical protein
MPKKKDTVPQYPFLDAISYKQYMAKHAQLRRWFKQGTWGFLLLRDNTY